MTSGCEALTALFFPGAVIAEAVRQREVFPLDLASMRPSNHYDLLDPHFIVHLPDRNL